MITGGSSHDMSPERPALEPSCAPPIELPAFRSEASTAEIASISGFSTMTFWTLASLRRASVSSVRCTTPDRSAASSVPFSSAHGSAMSRSISGTLPCQLVCPGKSTSQRSPSTRITTPTLVERTFPHPRDGMMPGRTRTRSPTRSGPVCIDEPRPEIMFVTTKSACIGCARRLRGGEDGGGIGVFAHSRRRGPQAAAKGDAAVPVHLAQ